MRKAFDALSAIVTQQLSRDVLSGELFVFVGKTRRRARVLYWDGTGLCLFCKRLEKGRFAAPWDRSGEGPLVLTTSELALLLEGSEFALRVPLSPAPFTRAERRVKFG
jgi:transposase